MAYVHQRKQLTRLVEKVGGVEYVEPLPTCQHCGGRIRLSFYTVHNRHGGAREFYNTCSLSCGKSLAAVVAKANREGA